MASAGPHSSFESAAFAEYEREFRRYTQENLRSREPEEDFASEVHEAGAALEEKLDTLAGWWMAAGRVVVFAGAGASTSAGLPDYRGPNGLWTRKLRGEVVEDDLGCDAAGLLPTGAHDALVRLHAAGLLAHVVTTNVDGLFRKAGLPLDALSELHGNMYVEECERCGRHFERCAPVRTACGLFEHSTGRSCEVCGGPLRDILVNFGNTVEHVPSMEAQHDRAWVECMKAGLVVVLGSSLSVPTACELPEECLPPRGEKPDGGKLAIVNLQRTPKDSLASLRIFAACDDVVMPLAERLLNTC